MACRPVDPSFTCSFLLLLSSPDNTDTPYNYGCYLAVIVAGSLYIYTSLTNQLYTVDAVGVAFASHLAILAGIGGLSSHGRCSDDWRRAWPH